MAGETANYWANGMLSLLFNGVTLATIAQNVTSGALTNLYVSLHINDPTSAGNQTSSEVTYTGYARVAVARNSSSPAWTVSGNAVVPNANIVFPTGTGGSGTAAFFGIGTASSGAGNLLYAGPITPAIVTGPGVTPTLTTATTVTQA
jgi:hypothetical protein